MRAIAPCIRRTGFLFGRIDFNGNVTALLKDWKGKVERVVLNEYCATPGHCATTGDFLEESGFILLRRTDAPKSPPTRAERRSPNTRCRFSSWR